MEAYTVLCTIVQLFRLPENVFLGITATIVLCGILFLLAVVAFVSVAFEPVSGGWTCEDPVTELGVQQIASWIGICTATVVALTYATGQLSTVSWISVGLFGLALQSCGLFIVLLGYEGSAFGLVQRLLVATLIAWLACFAISRHDGRTSVDTSPARIEIERH
jgi:hypothetical protein